MVDQCIFMGKLERRHARKQHQVTCDSVNFMFGEKTSDSCYMSTKTVAQKMQPLPRIVNLSLDEETRKYEVYCIKQTPS